MYTAFQIFFANAHCYIGLKAEMLIFNWCKLSNSQHMEEPVFLKI